MHCLESAGHIGRGPVHCLAHTAAFLLRCPLLHVRVAAAAAADHSLVAWESGALMGSMVAMVLMEAMDRCAGPFGGGVGCG